MKEFDWTLPEYLPDATQSNKLGASGIKSAMEGIAGGYSVNIFLPQRIDESYFRFLDREPTPLERKQAALEATEAALQSVAHECTGRYISLPSSFYGQADTPPDAVTIDFGTLLRTPQEINKRIKWLAGDRDSHLAGREGLELLCQHPELVRAIAAGHTPNFIIPGLYVQYGATFDRTPIIHSGSSGGLTVSYIGNSPDRIEDNGYFVLGSTYHYKSDQRAVLSKTLLSGEKPT